jgi:hexokinase
MKIMKKKDLSFKKKLDGIYPLITNQELVKYSEIFRRELLVALSNQKSSLPTILNPIHRMNPNPTFGVAVSIGGTNGYASAFRVSNTGAIKFLNRKMFSLPTNTSKDNLFSLMTENIFAVAKKMKKPYPIGIGFAYPLKPLLHSGFIDGEMLYETKGRVIKGLVGKKVGQEYHKYLKNNHKFDTKVVVANDSICLLLGGCSADVAGVVGTGLNFAYWEKRIGMAPMKLSELAGFGQSEVAINIESANFDKIKETFLRKIVDKNSYDRSNSLSEKETAGAYLYQIFNAGISKLLPGDFIELTSTDQLNDILTNAYKYPDPVGEREKKTVKDFAERVFRRSAQIVAIQLCGILLKIGKTKGMVPIVMEGGIFWKAHNYSTLVTYYIHLILPEVIPSFARLFGSSRRGIAILASGS